MRQIGRHAALLAALGACAAPGGQAPSRAEVCIAAFRTYDRAVRQDREVPIIGGRILPRPPLTGTTLDEENALRQQGCVGPAVPVRAPESVDLSPHAMPAGGTPVSRRYVHVGIVGSNALEGRIRRALGAQGFDTVGKGADRLGRRVFIGPVRTAEAEAAALGAARALGFEAAYALPLIP